MKRSFMWPKCTKPLGHMQASLYWLGIWCTVDFLGQSEAPFQSFLVQLTQIVLSTDCMVGSSKSNVISKFSTSEDAILAFSFVLGLHWILVISHYTCI